jgi:hypothetical protein
MSFLRKYYSQLFFLCIGLLAGFFVSRLPIKFEEKISPIAAATFILTILLALYLEFKVRPSLSSTRNEKDILIDAIKDIKSKLGELHVLYLAVRETSPVVLEKQSEVLAKLRELSNLIALLKEADGYCGMYQRLAVPDKIFKAYIKYKKALTGKKFNDPNFAFDRLNWMAQENAYRQHMMVLNESIFDYNKAI